MADQRTAGGNVPKPEVVADGVTLIDLNFLGRTGVIGTYLVDGDGELALIETGPPTTRPQLEQGLQDVGITFNDISRLIVTHIHLDHAGASGGLLRDYPHLRLSVHPVGAPHLVEPSRLLSSATRIYGDRMEELWGEVVPLADDRVDVLSDGGRVQVGNRSLLARFTPGHASHHVAVIDERTGTLFTGDAAGVRVAGTEFVCPTAPPPDIDLDAWRGSIHLMKELRPERLALTHYGVFADVDRHLDALCPNLDAFVDAAREMLAGDGDTSRLIDRLLDLERQQYAASSDIEGIMDRLELATPAYMTAMGLQRLLKKRGELG